jgi:phage-related protein
VTANAGYGGRNIDDAQAGIIIEFGDAHRVFYVTKFAEGIYVLHAFAGSRAHLLGEEP